MELLIVIVIIGILAVAVLAALNPLEQIRRGADTGKKANSRELLNGIDRFTAVSGALPTSVADGTNAIDNDLRDAILTELGTLSELKAGALSTADFSGHHLTKQSDGSISICFHPDSDKFQTDAVAKQYLYTGVVGACTAETCYSCIPE